MPDWLHELVRGHGTWAVAVVIFLESMGLPLPGEAMLIGAAIYASAVGGLTIGAVVFWAAVGAVMGDNVGYLIGRKLGRRLLERFAPRIGLTPERLMLGDYLFDKHGPKVVFFGRFTALLRTLAALLAGAARLPWPRFLLWNALGGICWTSFYGFGAYWLGSRFPALLGPLGMVFGAVVVVAVGALFLTVRRQEARLLAEARRARSPARAAPALAAPADSPQA